MSAADKAHFIRGIFFPWPVFVGFSRAFKPFTGERPLYDCPRSSNG